MASIEGPKYLTLFWPQLFCPGSFPDFDGLDAQRSGPAPGHRRGRRPPIYLMTEPQAWL